MAEPPERNSSALMPYSFSNRLTIFWACGSGVEVYQTTLPSALALARSTVSWARVGVASVAIIVAVRISLNIHFSRTSYVRHAQPCAGHPRLSWLLARRGWPGQARP